MAIQNLEANIKGMHCAACSSRIERVVGNLEGVASCSVNLATEKANIEYESSKTDISAIEQAVAGLGFTAEAASDDTDIGADQEEAIAQLQAMKSRLLPSFILAMLIMCLSMADMVGITLPEFIHPAHSPLTYALVQFLLLLPVLYFGRNFYLIGLPALFRGVPNMDSLIAIGTGAAFVYSSWNLVEISLGIDAAREPDELLGLGRLGEHLQFDVVLEVPYELTVGRTAPS
jgi:Cu+-exporting ATPase